jgi:ATPase subunit of ABC transporter with duplicated ATPase domains
MGRPAPPQSHSDTVVPDDMNNMEQPDAEWAEALALRILLARVRPERRAEATERVRGLLRDLEAPRAAGARRLPVMSGGSRRRLKGRS